MRRADDVIDSAAEMKARGEPFAVATVVRTVAATAVKAGAKALIRADGTISEGWIGGGCARAAVLKAAREAIADGQPRLVSVQPPDALQEQGVRAGEERAGVRFARNLCPSHGTWTCSSRRCCRGRRSSSAAPAPLPRRSPTWRGASASR
jgi:xanthine dehydrogenase accessory factor